MFVQTRLIEAGLSHRRVEDQNVPLYFSVFHHLSSPNNIPVILVLILQL